VLCCSCEKPLLLIESGEEKLKTMQESLNTLINMFSCSENGVSSIDTTSLNMTLKNLVSTTAELGEDITKLKDLIGYLNIYSEFKCCLIYLQLFIGIINLE